MWLALAEIVNQALGVSQRLFEPVGFHSFKRRYPASCA